MPFTSTRFALPLPPSRSDYSPADGFAAVQKKKEKEKEKNIGRGEESFIFISF